MSRESQRNALLIQHCYSPYRTTQFEKTIKKRQKGPVLAIKGPFGDLGGPRRTLGDQIWSQRPPIGPSGLESCSPHTLTWYRARFGPKCPFWGPQRSSEGPGGPNLILTAPDWSAWAGLMLTTHFDLVSGPFWVPRGPKRARFGPKCPLALNFHGPILCRNFFLEI